MKQLQYHSARAPLCMPVLARVVAFTLVALLYSQLWACTADKAQTPSAAAQLAQLRDQGIALSPEGEHLLSTWLTPTPDVRIMTAAEADLNADGFVDMVLIHSSREEHEKMTLVVLLQQSNSSFIATNFLPAPVENQRISFKNIDEKPPLEFIVMGSKGIRSGIAVYRIVNGQLVDLFNNGMDDCC